MTVEESLEQHRVLWDVLDEGKFFDSSLTLSARYSFHSAIFRADFCYLQGDERCYHELSF